MAGYRAPVANSGERHPAALPDLIALPGVPEAVEAARTAITALRGHPAQRRGRERIAAAAAVRAARACAALDGAPLLLEAWDSATDTVVDPRLAGALRVAASLAELKPVWQRAPLQALARLHVLAAADLSPPDQLGRPRPDLGIAQRLTGLAGVMARGPWPAPVMVSVVHGELLALRPFGSADGVVARGAARLTMMSSGLDPEGLGVPEVAHLRCGARYRKAVDAFASGEAKGVAQWILLVCDALIAGAREGGSIADATS